MQPLSACKIDSSAEAYRHELKFLCTQIDLSIIAERLKYMMSKDTHTGHKGMYTVRSLYFDDVMLTGLYENESGVDSRKKLRIRLYNGSLQHICLELKRKRNNMTRKESCPLLHDECRLLMQGEIPPARADCSSVLQQLCLLMRTRGMKPVHIVEYERTAFVYPLGNVRITLDRNIAGSGNVAQFLHPSIKAMPVLEAGQHILEVKYDAYLPDAIAQVLQTGRIRQTSFSKYYAAMTQMYIR